MRQSQEIASLPFFGLEGLLKGTCQVERQIQSQSYGVDISSSLKYQKPRIADGVLRYQKHDNTDPVRIRKACH